MYHNTAPIHNANAILFLWREPNATACPAITFLLEIARGREGKGKESRSVRGNGVFVNWKPFTFMPLLSPIATDCSMIFTILVKDTHVNVFDLGWGYLLVRVCVCVYEGTSGVRITERAREIDKWSSLTWRWN